MKKSPLTPWDAFFAGPNPMAHEINLVSQDKHSKTEEQNTMKI